MLVIYPLTVPFSEKFFGGFMGQDAEIAELAAQGYAFGLIFIYLEQQSLTCFVFLISMRQAN